MRIMVSTIVVASLTSLWFVTDSILHPPSKALRSNIDSNSKVDMRPPIAREALVRLATLSGAKMLASS